ncbi:hypothetical protein ACSAZL_01275 [Methanosarcina sp. T3]|uniref:hypothetical protein n=1 Tax=Methanosarcina sp. T3 TaxID=3439062 RepID=UPI003F846C8B
MSETVQVGSQNQPNAPPPRVTQTTEWNSPGYPQPQQYENANYVQEEGTEEGDGFFEQASTAISSGAAYVVNGVEQFLNPEKTQSFSLNDLIAKGENVTSAEKSILESQGYVLTPNYERQVIGHESYEAHAARMGVSASFLRSWAAKWGKDPTAIYGDVLTGYTWVKGAGESSLNSVKATAWGVLQDSYEAGHNFGKNTLKPTLQDYGLYDQSRAAVYDLYNKSPLKYIPEPELNATIDVSADTLRIAKGEGIPVTYADGIFTINAQGANYDKYAARLNEIQLNLFNEKKTALENEFNIQKTKREASIFGTGLTWDEGINKAASYFLPDKWTVDPNIKAYGESGKFGSGALKGLTDAYGDWYNKKVAVAPVNVLTEIGGEVAIGAVTGAAFKVGTTAVRGGLVAGSDVLAAGAGKVGANAAGKVLTVGAKGLTVGARAVQPVADAVLGAQIVQDVASSESYAEGWGKVGSLAVGGLGFGAGAKMAGKSKSIAAIDAYAGTKAPNYTIKDAGNAVMKVSDTAADLQIRGIKNLATGTERMMVDETAVSSLGKKALDRWDALEKSKKAKVSGEPAFELVETERGFELREVKQPQKTVEVKKPEENVLQEVKKREEKPLPIDKFTASQAKGREIINRATIKEPGVVETQVGKQSMLLRTEMAKPEQKEVPVFDLSKIIDPAKESSQLFEFSNQFKEVSPGTAKTVEKPKASPGAYMVDQQNYGLADFIGQKNKPALFEKSESVLSVMDKTALDKKLKIEQRGKTITEDVLAQKQRAEKFRERAAILKEKNLLKETGTMKELEDVKLSEKLEAPQTTKELTEAKELEKVKTIQKEKTSELERIKAVNILTLKTDAFPRLREEHQAIINPRTSQEATRPGILISVLGEVQSSDKILNVRDTPKSIRPSISSPVQDIPNPAKEITIDSIISKPKTKPTDDNKRPVVIPTNIIDVSSSITPSKPVISPGKITPVPEQPTPDIIEKTDITDSIKPVPIPIRSHSHVTLPGPDIMFRSDIFGKGSLNDEYKPKKFVTPGISGTMKKGYLRNQFGSLEGFAKKVSGNKVGFKKIKIR